MIDVLVDDRVLFSANISYNLTDDEHSDPNKYGDDLEWQRLNYGIHATK